MSRILKCVLIIATFSVSACGGGGGGGSTQNSNDSGALITTNSAPIAAAESVQSTNTFNLVTLDGKGSVDKDGDSLTYSWSITSKPDGSNAEISNPNAEKPTITPDLEGDYKFQLIVNDGKLSSTPYTMTVTANRAFHQKASLNQKRQMHTATLLADGRILVTGGCPNANCDSGTANDVLETTEIYDPQNDTWTPSQNMAHKRFHHTAVLLPNGKVLVAGGVLNSSESTAEIYDPLANIWTAAAPPPEPLINATATGLGTQNRNVLFASPFGFFLYDPTTNTWTTITTMLYSLVSYNDCILTSSGSVIFIGAPKTDSTLGQIIEYSQTQNTITTRGLLTNRSINQRTSLMSDGGVLITGGYIYTPGAARADTIDSAQVVTGSDGSYSSAETSSMFTARSGHTATTLHDGNILISGGSGTNNIVIAIKTAEIYNTKTKTWKLTGEMLTPRTGHIAVKTPNGSVIFIGGTDSSSHATASTEAFY